MSGLVICVFLKATGESSGVAEKVDDEEYEDEAGPSMCMEKNQTQSAVDITAQFVYERLKPNLVTDLVLTSLVSQLYFQQFCNSLQTTD